MSVKSKIVKTFAALAAVINVSNIPAHLEDDNAFQFPAEESLNPSTASDYSQRVINPLWAPTSYLQGIDCNKDAYTLKDLSGEHVQLKEYALNDPGLEQAAKETSLGYSIYVDEAGHAVINLKAIGKPFAFNEHEQTLGIIKDVLDRESQYPVLDLIVEKLINDEDIETIESVGFAQGSAGVYHLASKYNIIGTNVSDTGTDYTDEHLQDLVISLDVPGDIHSLSIGKTGEHKPAQTISLGEAHQLQWQQLYTPVETSWVEKIEALAFEFPEAQAPKGYKDQGKLTLFDFIGEDETCDNPTMP